MLVEQHCANIGSDLSKSNTRSDHDEHELIVSTQLARLKADLKHKISQQNEASDKISHQDEASDKISQVFEASEVPPSESISFLSGSQEDEKGSLPKHLTKAYQVAVVCKEAKSLADEATYVREEVRPYKATGVSKAEETKPIVGFNHRLTALQTA